MKEEEQKSCSTILLSSSSLPPTKIHQKFIITTFRCHGPLSFFLLVHLLRLFHRKTRWTTSVGIVGFNMCPFSRDFETPWSLRHSFLGVKHGSGLRTSSIANPRFHKTLGRRHGPWCKQPLRATSHTRLKARDHLQS